MGSRPDFSVKVTPTSNAVEIVVGKTARFLLGGEMPAFFAAKVKGAGGDPKQVALVRFGAMAKVGGVAVASVPAVHSKISRPAGLGARQARPLLPGSGRFGLAG